MEYTVVFLNGHPTVYGNLGAIPGSYVLSINFPTAQISGIKGVSSYLSGPGKASIIVNGQKYDDVPLNGA